MFDDIVRRIPPTLIDIDNVVDRIRQQTDDYIKSAQGFMGLFQPSRECQVKSLEMLVSNGTEIINVPKFPIFHVVTNPNDVYESLDNLNNSSILSLHDYKSDICGLPNYTPKSVFISAWSELEEGGYLVRFSMCLNKVYIHTSAIYTL